MLIAAFILLAGGLLALDIYSANKRENNVRTAAIWSCYYIVAALVYAGLIGFTDGWQSASLFTTGYVLEKVLSVDNLLVFSAVFAYFKTPQNDQYKILKWGILGAIVFRLMFTAVGVGSMHLFGGWAEILFAVLIAFSAFQMLKDVEEGDDLPKLAVWLNKKYPMWGTFAVTLLTIEMTDVMFAFDSVPTIIAVTKEPILIYTSMMFAILGLRSLYFLLAAIQDKMVYVEKAVIAVLFFISTKLALHALFHVEILPSVSFGIVMGMLTLGVVTSLFAKPKH